MSLYFGVSTKNVYTFFYLFPPPNTSFLIWVLVKTVSISQVPVNAAFYAQVFLHRASNSQDP
jgi:hypothetical protein